jgi:hypothetical protein
MSAIIGNFGYTSCDPVSDQVWVKNQPAFYLHPEYTIEDLKSDLAKALQDGRDTVWVLNPGKCNGRTGLCTWYVAALIPQLERT